MPTEVITAFITAGGMFLVQAYVANKTHSVQEVKQNATIEAIKAENKATCEAIMYRICELEKKQDKHNKLIERMAVVENDIKTLKK